jgi:arylsulfatase A-like enzyme
MSAKQTSNDGINRRQVLKRGLYGGLAASLAPALWLSGCRKSSSGKRPNVILISIDTLRADHLACYGYSRPTSPIIDKFASDGLLFEDVSSTSPWTLPAHGSLLTGLYPNRHALKSYNVSLPAQIVTLAEVFRKKGFSTTAIVNSHSLSRRYGLDRGFNEFTYIEEKLSQVGPTEVEGKALAWISRYRGGPFFLFLHYYDVHSDYRSLPRYQKQFVGPYSGIADGSTDQLMRYRKGQIGLNQADARHLVDLYDASIRQMDDGLGRLFKFLGSRGLFDNTVVVITSDHGEEFLEHGGVLHTRTQFQEVIQVPLVIRGPDIPKSKRVKYNISLVDLMPTLLALFDITIPPALDGINLCPLWRINNFHPPHRYIFSAADQYYMFHDIKRAVRHPRYKLIYDRWRKKMRFYDLFSDPQEKVDVASEHRFLVDTMFSKLEEYISVNQSADKIIPLLPPEEINGLKSLGYL